eukprot:gb/GFBE01062691.1/.p1 GENE.gb/GFBE01062691.1/~~gb/GFBE01062691.1/.p1  ORF type:complete len:319 (+),score=62.79 gb/GFBE01062691.1/:1-957(+)
MDFTLQVTSLSGQTLLCMQIRDLGQGATVAQLEEHMATPAGPEEDVVFMSEGKLLDDETLLADLPGLHDDMAVHVQRVVKSPLKFCLPITDILQVPVRLEVSLSLSRKAAAQMTAIQLKERFRQRLAEQSRHPLDHAFLERVRHHFTITSLMATGRRLPDRDLLTQHVLLADVDEVHFSLTPKDRWEQLFDFLRMDDADVGGRVGAVYYHVPIPGAPLDGLHLMGMPPPLLPAAHGQHHQADQLGQLGQRGQLGQHWVAVPAPAFAEQQAAPQAAPQLSQAELQNLMQQRLASSLQQNRAAYFEQSEQRRHAWRHCRI